MPEIELASSSEQEEEGEDVPALSPLAMAALHQFVSEQLEVACQGNVQQTLDDATNSLFREDWQLSQFWYDDATCQALAGEAVRLAGVGGHVVCLSCPTLYRHLRRHRPPGLRLTLLEFDRRFDVFGDEFVWYDYRQPLAVPATLRGAANLLVADPPFLSEECLTKTAITIRLLAKQHVLLCTGAQMGELAARLLHTHECKFRPRHTNNLANEFRCYANYDLDSHVTSAAKHTDDAPECTNSGDVSGGSDVAACDSISNVLVTEDGSGL